MSDPADTPLPGLWARVGLALTSPARAFALSDEAAGRAGLSDAVSLLFLKILCLEATALVAAGWSAVSVGVMPALSGLGPRLQQTVGADLVFIFLGGLFLTLAAGARRRPARDFDLAAVAWTPYLVASLVATLAARLTGVHPGRPATDVLGLAALTLMAGWLGLAVRHARRRAPAVAT